MQRRTLFLIIASSLFLLAILVTLTVLFVVRPNSLFGVCPTAWAPWVPTQSSIKGKSDAYQLAQERYVSLGTARVSYLEQIIAFYQEFQIKCGQNQLSLVAGLDTTTLNGVCQDVASQLRNYQNQHANEVKCYQQQLNNFIRKNPFY